jgi:hypothetical protein
MREQGKDHGTKYVQSSQVKAFARVFDEVEIDIQKMFRDINGETIKEKAKELWDREINSPNELLAWSKEVAELFTDAFGVPDTEKGQLRGTITMSTLRVYKAVWGSQITRNASRILGLTV